MQMGEAAIVVALVTHDWGGRARTLAYVKRKGKEIINYGTL